MAPVKRRRRRLRGLARVSKHRFVKPVLATMGILVLVWLLWCGWTAGRVYSDLSTAKDQAFVLRAALARGDAPGAQTASGRLSEASEAAAERTNGLTWRALRHLPVVGDDLSGLAEASNALNSIASEGVPPLVESARSLTVGSFAPSDHQFPLELIASLEGGATDSHTVFTNSAQRLRQIDSSGFVSPLRTVFDDLRDQVVDASRILDTAERAARLMPSLLGADGQRDYLFVFQNNAEVRATGGLPGALSLVHAEDGRVDITRQASSGDFGELDRPVVPLSRAEKLLFGSQLGTYFTDANFTPDFPRASLLWQARWKVTFGQDLDGIFVVDPVAMSYLIAATGPIQVDGVTLTADNLVQILENTVYANVTPAAQDEFFKHVAKAAFDVFAAGRGDQVRLVRGLARGISEGRIRIHSFDIADQSVITGTEIAGGLPNRPTTQPQVGVYLNDGTGAKMSYFLDYRVSVTSTSCSADRQHLRGSLRITSDTPGDVAALPEYVTGYAYRLGGFDRGDQIVVADIYAPVGGTLGDFTLDDEDLPRQFIDRYRGRVVVSIGLRLKPGQTRVVDWSIASGQGQLGPAVISVTPGARPENESSVAPSICQSAIRTAVPDGETRRE